MELDAKSGASGFKFRSEGDKFWICLYLACMPWPEKVLIEELFFAVTHSGVATTCGASKVYQDVNTFGFEPQVSAGVPRVAHTDITEAISQVT